MKSLQITKPGCSLLRKAVSNMKKRDKYLIVSIIAVVANLALNVWLATGDHSIPDVVNLGWFAFWGTEIYQIAKIKRCEVEKGEQ